MKEIELTQDQVALVDDEDYEWLSGWKWCAGKRDLSYATRSLPRIVNTRRITLSMHNEIWEYHYGPIPDGYTVDHEDRNPLNDQKYNLRLATAAQQVRNRGMNKNNTSGYIGVSFHKRDQKYRPSVYVDHKTISLGYFDDPEEAARVRDEAALRYYGEFAVLNFPG